MGAANAFFGQGPLQSPSVFNFFSPFYAPAGEIRNRGLVAPELQIATEFQNTLHTIVMFIYAFTWNSANQANLDPDNVFIDIDEDIDLADDIDALIDHAAGKLLGGEMSSTLRTEIEGMLAQIPDTDAAARAAETIYLIVTSPEYAYQR
jgi:phage head maturation protease